MLNFHGRTPTSELWTDFLQVKEITMFYSENDHQMTTGQNISCIKFSRSQSATKTGIKRKFMQRATASPMVRTHTLCIILKFSTDWLIFIVYCKNNKTNNYWNQSSVYYSKILWRQDEHVFACAGQREELNTWVNGLYLFSLLSPWTCEVTPMLFIHHGILVATLYIKISYILCKWKLKI